VKKGSQSTSPTVRPPIDSATNSRRSEERAAPWWRTMWPARSAGRHPNVSAPWK